MTANGCYISSNGTDIKSLKMPGIVRDDEPNDIFVEIFSGSLPYTLLRISCLISQSFE